MDKLISTSNGGFPVVLDDLRFIEQAIRNALSGFLKGFGELTNSYVLIGCSSSGGSRLPGYIALDGEVLQFDGQVIPAPVTGYTLCWDVVVTYDGAGNKVLRNSTTTQAYQVRKAQMVNIIDSGLAGKLVVGDHNYIADRICAMISGSGSTVLPAYIKSVLPFATKFINIGPWDMSSFAQPVAFPAHGIADFKKIRDISVLIIDDAETKLIPLVTGGTVMGSCVGLAYARATDIFIERRNGDFFDSADYSVTTGPFNRGVVKIDYIL